MFTGIIKEIGHIEKIKKISGGGLVLAIKSKKIKPTIGESVSVNGVCLTVRAKTKFHFTVDVVPETMRLTNLSLLQENSPVNLEPSLRMNDALSGHFVTGHIDAIGKVKNDPTIRTHSMLTITFPKKLKRFIVTKGSIAINGVSLTIARFKGLEFTVALIPHTITTTNLGKLIKGDFVNIEIDVISRYAQNRHYRLDV